MNQKSDVAELHAMIEKQNEEIAELKQTASSAASDVASSAAGQRTGKRDLPESRDQRIAALLGKLALGHFDHAARFESQRAVGRGWRHTR